MILIVLLMSMLSASFVIFCYAFQVTALNRLVTNIPNTLFETAIPLTTQDEKVELYFDQEMVKKQYESYLEKEAKKYCENYQVEYYFYNVSDGGYCDINNCQGVEITFSTNLMLNIHYSRTMKYEIREGKIYG